MGFVGLTLAVALAEQGFNVLGLEIDQNKIHQLIDCKVHFHEEGLAARCKQQFETGRLKFAHPDTFENLHDYTVFIMTVGTPLDEQGVPRMDMVERSAKYIAEKMPEGALTILRSTVKLGTTRSVVQPLLEASGKTFDLAYCSERTLEGKALEELSTNPQIIGGLNFESSVRAEEIFSKLTPKVIHVSTLEAAELIKLLDNSFRDYSFAFGNEVALICEAAGLNASEVIETANWEYSRTNIPRPGFVGGPCLEKDPHILCNSLQQFGFTPRLVKLARAQNEYLPIHVVDRIEAWIKKKGMSSPPDICILGLAFKGVPETDDTRGTPAKILIEGLKARWPDTRIYGADWLCSIPQIKELGVIPIELKAWNGLIKIMECPIVVVANNHPLNGRHVEEYCTADKIFGRLVVDCCGAVKLEQISNGVEYMRLGDNG